MLKGRGKTFAPKKVPRKAPGPSATSSARPSVEPSVERQSQTPAPSQPTQEEAAHDIQAVGATEIFAPVDVPAVAPPIEEVADQQVQPAVVATQNVQNTGRLEKRKQTDDVVAPPPPKRVSTAVERPELSTAEVEPSPAVDAPSQEDAPGLPTPKSVPRKRINPPKSNFAKTTTADVDDHNIEPETQGTRDALGEQIIEAENSGGTIMPPSAALSNPQASSTPTGTDGHTHPQPEVPTRSQPEAPKAKEHPPQLQHSRSASPARDEIPEAQRYPSPVNVARLADEAPEGSGMGRAGDRGSALGTADVAHTALRPGELGQGSEIVPTGVLNPDGTSGGIVVEEPASGTEKGKGKKKKVTKRRKVQPPRDETDLRATVEVQLNRPRRVGSSKKGKKSKESSKGKGRRARAETPEGASDEEIDQSKLTMTELCKDLRIGKKFSMHDIIKQRVIDKKMENLKEKMRRNNPEIGSLLDGDTPEAADGASSPGAGASSEAGPSRSAPEPTPAPPKEAEPDLPIVTGSGPQMRIVDGNLVLDEASLTIDRQARANMERVEMEEVEENDFTRVITSGTYMKRERAQLWDYAANERFYEGLSQFGTDFEMIAKLFPHRNRRQIKLKFNKEEKVNEARVTKALIGPRRKAIDLDNFERLADLKLEEVDEIEAFQEAYEADMVAKQNEILEMQEEQTRQKKAAIQGSAAARKILASVDDDDEPGVGGSAKENHGQSKGVGRPKGKGNMGGYVRKPKKNKHSHYAGGEKVTVLGSIDG